MSNYFGIKLRHNGLSTTKAIEIKKVLSFDNPVAVIVNHDEELDYFDEIYNENSTTGLRAEDSGINRGYIGRIEDIETFMAKVPNILKDNKYSIRDYKKGYEVMATEQKKIILKGKRYKVIEESIAKKESNGVVMPESMKIDLHFAYYLAMEKIKMARLIDQPEIIEE